MLTRLRQAIAPISLAIGRTLATVVPNPNFWTLVGLLLSLLAAYLFAIQDTFLAAISVLGSGFMDVVDGAVARATGRITRRGGFLDSNIDRVGESVIYIGLMFSPGWKSVVAGVALATSLLVSYSRARAEASGLKAEGVGIGERAERLLVLVIGGLLGPNYLYFAVLLVALISLLTFLQRIYVYGSALKD